MKSAVKNMGDEISLSPATPYKEFIIIAAPINS